MATNYAVFECVGPKGARGNVRMALKPGVTPADAERHQDFAKPLAARKFKRIAGLHPCCKVTCTFKSVIAA